MINKKILWLVTARSGSKAIPNKNIKKIGSYTLLEHKIKSVVSLSFDQEIWLSTDSEKYANIGKKAGAKVPFIRPQNISKDTSSSVDVVLHALEYAKKNNYNFSYIGLLEPTSPFVKPSSLEDAFKLLLNNEEAEGIVAVKEIIPHKIFFQDDDTYLIELSKNLKKIKKQNRQSFPVQITPSGGFYIYKVDRFFERKTFYSKKTLSFKLSGIESIEIDLPEDFDYAKYLYKINKL